MNCKHTERNVSLDLLRVLCMFLIVLGHALFHGKVLDALPANSANYFIISILRTVLSVHVNCFVLISGYFLCMREFQLKRAILIWGQAFFWSIGLYIVLYFCGAVDLDLKSLIKACFPITQQRYWFITTYVLMLFFGSSPECGNSGNEPKDARHFFVRIFCNVHRPAKFGFLGKVLLNKFI